MKKIFYLLALAAFVLAGCDGDLPERYTVDATDDGHGSVEITVDGKPVTKASESTTVLLTATPQEGYVFGEWVVVKGGVSLLPDATSNPAEFEMPARDVSVRAEFVKGVLINDVVWATANVDKPGTFAAKPEDAGMFYQWGKKVGWSATDPMINSDGGTTWDDSTVSADAWPSIYDPCPKGWRVPTYQDFQKLSDDSKVLTVWTTQNGVKGTLFIDAATEKSIFLPAPGCRTTDGTLGDVGNGGYYWSAAPNGASDAYYLSVSGSDSGLNYNDDRGYGFSVRCVAE